MKKVIATALLLVVVLVLLVLGFRQNSSDPAKQDTPLPLPESQIHLTIQHQGQLQDMDLNTYLWGVVAAEMPASFSQEALSAQAVAARTYAFRKAGRSTTHPSADLCTDYHCCQAWISREEAEANWGKDAVYYSNKITTAITETADEVLLYDGKLIDAVFHSSSCGATQDALAVWGNDVPYLKSVSTPEGEGVPKYQTTAVIPIQEFKDLFLKAYPDADLSGEPSTWIGPADCTPEGIVKTITIGGVTVTGTQARETFSLRSPAFTMEATEDGISCQTTGFGHGVGMSQYGAHAMAEAGRTYQEILQHYYTGVTVEQCPKELLPQPH